jgi:hypothetical protein
MEAAKQVRERPVWRVRAARSTGDGHRARFWPFEQTASTVKLDMMMLANYAEVTSSGLLYVAGGSWDTTTINAPLPDGAPEGAVALLNGYLAVRILFHVTETDREHRFALTIMDEDGGEIARLEGEIRVDRSPDLPPGWDHGINMAIGLTGIAVFRFGLYTISLQVDGQHLGDRPFRVVRGYDDA